MIYYDEYCDNISKLQDKLTDCLFIAKGLVEFEEMWSDWSKDYTREGYAKDVYQTIKNTIEVTIKTN